MYRPTLDDYLRPILSPDDVSRTDEILELSKGLTTTTRHAKADVRCNQLGWDMAACDFVTTIEDRPDEITAHARRTIAAHLRRQHASLGEARIRSIVLATHFTLGDFGG